MRPPLNIINRDKYFKSWNLKRFIFFIKPLAAVSMFTFPLYHHGIYDLPSFLLNATHELYQLKYLTAKLTT